MKKIIFVLSFIGIAFMGFAQMNMAVNAKAPKPITLPSDSFDAEGYKVDLYYLAHASLVIAIRDGQETTWVYVDPVSRMGETDIDYSVLPEADLVLYTHDHPDHIDKKALEQHATDRTMIIAPFSCRGMVNQAKVTQNAEYLLNDKVYKYGNSSVPIFVKAVPAYNTTKGREQFHPKGKGNGYMLTIGKKWTLYIAGDTEPIPEMADFAKEFQIEVALLPVNQPYTMTPEQFESAVKVLKPHVVIPYHMGDTKMDKAIIRVKKNFGTDIRFHEELR